MFWLKKAAPTEPLAVSMAGVKLGDRLLVLGCGDPVLVAQLAQKCGLTGTAFAFDENVARAERASGVVAREGALVETLTGPWTTLPFDAAAFDVVVIRDVLSNLELHRRTALAGEALRTLRPGGRCLVIEGGGRGGLGALLQRRTVNAEYTSSGGAERTLASAGFRAVRTLAERSGFTFVEGVKGGAA
jgi:ubiquinone/menaquinone biosynthesis C-methylase UbiE